MVRKETILTAYKIAESACQAIGEQSRCEVAFSYARSYRFYKKYTGIYRAKTVSIFKFTEKSPCHYIPEMDNVVIDSGLPGYVSVHEAAKIIGCSESRVYQYVRAGRLPARKFGNTLALPVEAVQNFRRVPAGRQGEAPPWRRYRNHARLLMTTIDVQVRSGTQEEMHKKFQRLEEEEYLYIFTKTVARYIRQKGEAIRIVLIWKDTEMPDDTTRQQDLRLFQQAFADVLDWETAEYSFDDVILAHT